MRKKRILVITRMFTMVFGLLAFFALVSHAEIVYECGFDIDTNGDGVADGWLLQSHHGELVPSLSTDCSKPPAAQEVTLQERGDGCLILADKHGQKGSRFIPVEPEEVYQLKFTARRTGKANLFVRPIGFPERKWKDPLAMEKTPVLFNTWRNYRAKIKIPADVHYLVFQAWISGAGEGSILIDEMVFTRGAEIYSAMDNININPDKGYHVKLHNGVPTIFHNGDPLFVNALHNCTWINSGSIGPLFQSMKSAGVRTHFIQAPLNWGKEFATGGLSKAGNAYPYLDKRIATILNEDPEARFLLNLHCFVPKSWYETHPEELLWTEDGVPMKTNLKRPNAYNSFASVMWRKEVGKRIRHLINHMREQDYYDHIMGMHSFAGWEGQWSWPRPGRDAYDDPKIIARLNKQCIDHSPAMTSYFRNWAIDQYNGDVDLLREAWEDPNVTFRNIKVPTEQELYDSQLYDFKDPAVGVTRYIRDYFRAFGKARVEALLYFGQIIKEETADRPILSGAYYGAPLFGHIGGSLNRLRGRHGYAYKFYEAPVLDYFISPPLHTETGVGGSTLSCLLAGTIQSHGKFIFLEHDIPTHLRVKIRHAFNELTQMPQNAGESIALMKRSFAYVLCNGMGIWWWDEAKDSQTGVPGWYNFQEWVPVMRQMTEIGNRALKKDRSSVAEIAVIYSERSTSYLKASYRGPGRDAIIEQMKPLVKIGAPIEVYALEDFVDIPDRRLYVFLNAYYVTEAQRKQIHATLGRTGGTALWIYAPGLISDNGLSVNGITSLTGIKTCLDTAPGNCEVHLVETEHPINEGLGGRHIGLRDTARGDGRIAPRFYIDDTETIILGRSDMKDDPVIAVKENGGWTSVYSTVLLDDLPFLQNVAREAGVHIYNADGTAVYANRSYVGIHVGSKGKYRLELPQRADIYDVFADKYVAKDAREWYMHSEGASTKLYCIMKDGEDFSAHN